MAERATPADTSSDIIAGTIRRTEQLPLHSRAILLVEDEWLVAEDLAVVLRGTGAEVIGPAATLPTALRLVDHSERIDAAVLNINLQGVAVFPLAHELRARGIPFLFLTGYGEDYILDEFSDVTRCQKPVGAAHVLEKLKELLGLVPA